MAESISTIFGNITSRYTTSTSDVVYSNKTYPFKFQQVDREMSNIWNSNRVPQNTESFLNNLPLLSPTSIINKSSQIQGQQTYGIKNVPAVQTVKRRTTANKKERRRTQSINNAFFCLRSKIPNVPYDTKLSKIKTLKLAILYINYLTEVIKGDKDLSGGFRSELMPLGKLNGPKIKKNIKSELKNLLHEKHHFIKCKGRTGWPQDVWQSVLKVSRD